MPGGIGRTTRLADLAGDVRISSPQDGEIPVYDAGLWKNRPQSYTHDQQAASATWDVAHNLSRSPAVTVVDTAGTLVFGDVQYLDANNVRVTFSVPFSGKAYCN